MLGTTKIISRKMAKLMMAAIVGRVFGGIPISIMARFRSEFLIYNPRGERINLSIPMFGLRWDRIPVMWSRIENSSNRLTAEDAGMGSLVFLLRLRCFVPLASFLRPLRGCF